MSEDARLGEQAQRAGGESFRFEKGQAFKIIGEDDPDEYYYVRHRVWNYDVDEDFYYPPESYHRQYEIGEVSTLGGNNHLITEVDLAEHYEPVDKETAAEVL